MDLEHFVTRFKDDPNLGRAIALYAIAPKNLAPQFQSKHFLRCGVAGSRETQNATVQRWCRAAETRRPAAHTIMSLASWVGFVTVLPQSTTLGNSYQCNS